MKSPRFLFLLASLAMVSGIVRAAESSATRQIATDKELLITALEVVNSPEANYPGVWSFGHLMDEAFGPDQSRKLVAAWLENWSNGSGPGCSDENRIPGREDLRTLIIAPWKLRDGYRDGQAEPWLPDLTHAPFRLLAIVNRMDLARPTDETLTPAPSTGGYSSGSSPDRDGGGEGRFVFAAVDSKGEPLKGGMTVIFEYGLDAPQKERAFDWATAWHKLGEHTSFDAAYQADLKRFTQLITNKRPKTETRTADAPHKPDLYERLLDEAPSDSRQLLRIRTNDGACGKLREFRQFDASPTGLVAVRLPGTPDEAFFDKGSKANRMLADWLDKQRVAPKEVQSQFALSGKEIPDSLKTEIPLSFALPASLSVNKKSRPVNGFVATVANNDKQFHWDGWGLKDERLRRVFSVQTCCGCHCGDTGTEFFHVAPRRAEEPAALSKFLRTDGSRLRLQDPASRDGFLSAEMEDRRSIFASLLMLDPSRSEFRRLTGSRKGFVH